MHEAEAYSSCTRSNTHLVYTTEDLRLRSAELTRFFGWECPKKALMHSELVKLAKRVSTLELIAISQALGFDPAAAIRRIAQVPE